MILCVIDGMSHQGFQIDDYPALSQMAREGDIGWVDTQIEGQPVDTGVCVGKLLGISRPLGRGYMEALGAGVPVGREDTVFRATWLNIDKNQCISGLCQEPPAFSAPGYWSIGAYRGAIVLKGERRVKTREPHSCIGQPIASVMPEGDEELARLVEKSMDGRHILAPWGMSYDKDIEKIKYNVGIVAGCNVAAGLGRALDLPVYIPKGATGDTDTDLEAKLDKALALDGQFDAVLLHINGADEAGHRRDRREKERFIAKVSELLLKKLYDRKLLICSDHGTEPESGGHTGGRQPLIAHGWGRQGQIGVIDGKKLIEEALQWQRRL